MSQQSKAFFQFSCLGLISWCFFILQAVQGEGECQNMRLGLHIEILFANFGFLAKPQPRVRSFQFTVQCDLLIPMA